MVRRAVESAYPRKLEQLVVINTGMELTSALAFHPYRPVLAVASEAAGVSLWRFEDSECTARISGASASHTTGLAWLNAHSAPLLAVSSDDGCVRVWSGEDEALSAPTLRTAVHAAPDVTPESGSGLEDGSAMPASWPNLGKEEQCVGPVRLPRSSNRELSTSSSMLESARLRCRMSAVLRRASHRRRTYPHHLRLHHPEDARPPTLARSLPPHPSTRSVTGRISPRCMPASIRVACTCSD